MRHEALMERMLERFVPALVYAHVQHTEHVQHARHAQLMG